jgi:hypothetical protein
MRNVTRFEGGRVRKTRPVSIHSGIQRARIKPITSVLVSSHMRPSLVARGAVEWPLPLTAICPSDASPRRATQMPPSPLRRSSEMTTSSTTSALVRYPLRELTSWVSPSGMW